MVGVVGLGDWVVEVGGWWVGIALRGRRPPSVVAVVVWVGGLAGD